MWSAATPLAAQGQGCIMAAPMLAGHGGGQDALAATTWQDWVGCAQRARDTLHACGDSVVLVGCAMGAGTPSPWLGASRAGQGGQVRGWPAS